MHMISLQTLCREAPGRYVQSYSEMSEAVRKVSAAPKLDVDQLFQRMAFNAALGNTDDHLKNFWMIHGPSGYRLAPAIDLLPDVGESHEHVLAFEYERIAPSRAELRAVARRWNVADAETRIDDVLKAVGAFRKSARANQVPPDNIDEFVRDIALRRAKMTA